MGTSQANKGRAPCEARRKQTWSWRSTAAGVVAGLALFAPSAAAAQSAGADWLQQAQILFSQLVSWGLLAAVILGLYLAFRYGRKQEWFGSPATPEIGPDGTLILKPTGGQNGGIGAHFRRAGQIFANEVLTNWRLVLLGVTGIVLSLASGWTTWDGMTDFTCPGRGEGALCFTPAILSFMITFGIQGVMLIAAWLIGETFATSFTGKSNRALLAVFGSLGAIVAGILIAAFVAAQFRADRDTLQVFLGVFQSIDAFVQTQTPGWTTVVLIFSGVLVASVAFG